MSTVVILGSGVMGSALAVPLADNGHDVRLVGTHLDREIIAAIRATGVHPGLGRELPASVRAYELEELERACADAEIVLSAVNSLGVRWAGERLAPLLREGQLVVAIAKGVTADEQGTLRLVEVGDGRPPELGGATVALDASGEAALADTAGPITIGFRPEALEVGDGPLRAQIRVVEDLGSEVFVHLFLEHRGENLALVSKTLPPFDGQPGDSVGLQTTGIMHVFAEDGSRIASTTATLNPRAVGVHGVGQQGYALGGDT
jgi:NAD-dependent glycerol-3-phosphate dehydrogenase N-terminus/TOBE domain